MSTWRIIFKWHQSNKRLSEFYLQDGGKKTASIDMKRNCITVTPCISLLPQGSMLCCPYSPSSCWRERDSSLRTSSGRDRSCRRCECNIQTHRHWTSSRVESQCWKTDQQLLVHHPLPLYDHWTLPPPSLEKNTQDSISKIRVINFKTLS